MSPTFVLELVDRPASLERVLNKCRRKNLTVDALLVGRVGDGTLKVTLSFAAPTPPPDRIAADLAKVYDVLAVEIRQDATLSGALGAAIALSSAPPAAT